MIYYSTKKLFQITHFIILPILICCFYTSSLYAANGLKISGSGAVSSILGGTGCAEPQDTAAMMINPAGITKIGNRVDFATELVLINQKLDTSAVSGAFGNPNGTFQNRSKEAALPHFGFSSQIEETPFYYGFATGLVSGFAVDYEQSRLNPGTTLNAYDRRAELYQSEFVPTLAYKPTEDVSLGFSLVGTFNRLETDTAKGFAVNSGHDNGSHAWGIGFNVGAIYDITEKIAFGASYKSMRWNQKFNEYANLAPRVNGAPEYILGIAYKPTPKLLIEHNTKYIKWRQVDIMRKSPENGGYGWEDQWVFGFGVQYALRDNLRLRCGYNYGSSPIKEDVVYANGLAALISEHHFALGLGYDLNEHITIDTGWMHLFKNSMEENGQGDSKSQVGSGTKTSLQVNSFYVGLSYRF